MWNAKVNEIYSALLNQMVRGELRGGDAFPREIELAEKFGTTRMNAHYAMNLLSTAGLALRVKRRGSQLPPNLDREKVIRLWKENSRRLMVLTSRFPQYIHWNQTTLDTLTSELLPQGYQVVFGQLPPVAEFAPLLRQLDNEGYAALLLLPDTADHDIISSEALLRRDLKMPIYMLNRSGIPLEVSQISQVSCDHFGDGFFIGKLLSQKKCRNIIIQEFASAQFSVARARGVRLGIGNAPDINLFTPSYGDYREQCGAFIRGTQERVTIVSSNNFFATVLLDYLKARGLQSPRDFDLITFDDQPQFESYEMTSLRVPHAEVGRIFARLIADDSWLYDYRGRVSISLPSELVVRQTFIPAS